MTTHNDQAQPARAGTEQKITNGADARDRLERLVMRDDTEDAELFRLWIFEASERPGRVAQLLCGCLTPDDYRTALRRLRDIPYTTQTQAGDLTGKRASLFDA